MKLSLTKIAMVVLIAFLFAGCASSPVAENNPSSSAKTTPKELYVGVSPNYPPLIFWQNETITGIEADLARRLGEAMNRPIRFVVLNWEDEIPALLDGRIDIIMSGMTVTKARGVRIVFAEPYLKSGLIAAFRAEDAKKYSTKDSILNAFDAVGAVQGTTGEAFVQKTFTVRKTILPKSKDGAYELKRRSIDIFVNDAPSIIWIVSENEADISALWEPLTEDSLAWGVRKEDQQLLMNVNSILKQWKQDGTLNAVLRKWLPEGYFKRINQ
jgi:polar amino acid transport system substrate-binding protein